MPDAEPREGDAARGQERLGRPARRRRTDSRPVQPVARSTSRSRARPTAARRRRGPTEQHLGSGNVTVALDLHFDTADEGSTDSPRQRPHEDSRRSRSSCCRAAGSSGPPPRVRFSWGDFVLVGVMGSLHRGHRPLLAAGHPAAREGRRSPSAARTRSVAANQTGPGAETAPARRSRVPSAARRGRSGSAPR